MSLSDRWQRFLNKLHERDRYRRLAVPTGIDFSSNDYLGYGKSQVASGQWPVNTDQKTREGAPSLATDGWPLATGHWPLSRSGQASRLLRGEHPLWQQVEAELARWHGAEAALVMTSGYSANEGLLSALVEPGDFLASDRCNHASIFDGIKLSQAERFVFRHNDLAHLEEGLRAANVGREAWAVERNEMAPAPRPTPPAPRGLFIVTESLFSMEADRAPLQDLATLAEKYGAYLIVDEAHATGCFGAQGGGLVDELGLRSRVLATVHTGGKALGVCGAYICCSQLLREVLVNRCRHFIFTTALPPIIAEWWLEMLERVPQDVVRREALHQAAAFFREQLAGQGIVAQGRDYIVPIILGDDAKAMRAAQTLQAAGFDIRAIRPPTVPLGTARLRISIHADHTMEELRAAAVAVGKAVAGP